MAVDVRGLLARSGRVPSKALGQNFVIDPNTCERIVRIARVGDVDHVVEIGAGLGSLTCALAASGAHVLAIEVDRHLIPLLSEVLTPFTRVRIVHADALEIDWHALLGSQDRWHLVANLPYNIAVPVLMALFEHATCVNDGVVMVQREVGERLVARPGAKHVGAVSAKVSYFVDASLAGNVSANVFHPRPRVDSVLVRFVRREAPPFDPAVVPYERFATVVNAGFAQRRKMLRRSLNGVVDQAAFEAVAVSASRRAEELTLLEWGALCAWPKTLEESAS